MSELAASYPLLRKRRRRRAPRLASGVVRALAFLVLGGLLIAGVIIAQRPAAPRHGQLLADTLTTLAAGNYSAARHNGERAVAAAPRTAPAHLALARAQLKLGDGLAAEASLGRARDLGAPAATLRPMLAESRLLQGDADGALAQLGPASGPDAERVRALATAAKGDGAQARAMLVGLTTRQPRDASAWTALGRLRLGAGDLAGAADAAARAVHADARAPEALTLQGEVIRTRYGPVAALPWFAAALKRDAFFYPALIEQAATLGDAGRNVEALAATRQALLARPDDAPALYLQAVIAARAGRFELAERLLGATGTALDGAPGAMLLQGALDERAGRHEQAVARWRALVAAQPMNVAARRLLGAALLRSGDPRGAFDVLRPIAPRADADGYSLLLIARAWEAAGDRSAAAAFLDRAATGARNGAELFATNEAVSALRSGAAGAPTDPTYALGVIRGLATAGDRAGALVRARALAAAAPGAPAARLALGDMLAATGDWRGAATAYASAADLQFDEPTALRLIDALGRTGRAKDAAATLALYLGQNPASLTAQRLRGHWQVAAGRWSEAIQTLEGVRRAGGAGDAALLVDFALAYAGDGDGAVARRYGAAAYRLAPMSAAACDAYGVALAADGDLTAARQLLDKAVALAPRDPVIAEHRRRAS